MRARICRAQTIPRSTLDSAKIPCKTFYRKSFHGGRRAPMLPPPLRLGGEPATVRKTATIGDVAKLAGVSPATVSNVLGERKPVNAKLVERVRQAAQDLGYQPHRAASYLRSGKSRIV